MYKAIELLRETHVQYCLLRPNMDACRFNDLLRTVPIGVADEAFSAASTALLSSFETCMGATLSPDHWAQACLPIRMGGLDFHSPSSIRPAARVPTIPAFCSSASSSVPFLSLDSGP